MSATVLRSDALRLPLRDESVDLIVTSPPYWAQRDYRDAGGSCAGQVGAEPTPLDFAEALWAMTAECKRVLRPSGSMFVNLGDKYGGSGGHNNSSLSPARTGDFGKRKHNLQAPRAVATRRNAPDRYNQAADVRDKSLLGLPWLYALGCTGALAGAGGRDPELELILRAELIWGKPNGLPESAADRAHRKHEHWFHFTKEPKYYSDIDGVRIPHAAHTLYCADWESKQGGYERKRSNPDRQDGGNNTSSNPPHPLGKIPGSVWTIATEPFDAGDYLAIDGSRVLSLDLAQAWRLAELRFAEGAPLQVFDVEHFAAFPTEWPRRLILGWCPPGGIVLDPFGGTGTTAMCARALGRVGVSVDLSADYCRLARWRIFESNGASKVRTRTNTESEAQTNLFTIGAGS